MRKSKPVWLQMHSLNQHSLRLRFLTLKQITFFFCSTDAFRKSRGVLFRKGEVFTGLFEGSYSFSEVREKSSENSEAGICTVKCGEASTAAKQNDDYELKKLTFSLVPLFPCILISSKRVGQKRISTWIFL